MNSIPPPAPPLPGTCSPATIEGAVPEALYRAGKPNRSNTSPRPGEDGVSFWDRLANPWPLSPGRRPVFRPGEPYFTIDPFRLPPGTAVPTPPEGHWIVKGVGADDIKQVVTDRDEFPK